MVPENVTVFGIGEAGSSVARHLVARDVAVKAFDPRPVPTPPGVDRHTDPTTAVDGSDVILALTAARDARTALGQALDRIPPGTLYADLSTASAQLKRDLAATAAHAGLEFADIALMGTVPDRGLATPQLAAGPAAEAYVRRLGPLGAVVEVVGPAAGDAAVRKLLRSIAIKGLTAALIEALLAARAAGVEAWLWEHLTEPGNGLEAGFVERLVAGTGEHADRRCDEMQAAAELLEELGIEPVLTRGTLRTLRSVRPDALPGPGRTGPGHRETSHTADAG